MNNEILIKYSFQMIYESQLDQLNNLDKLIDDFVNNFHKDKELLNHMNQLKILMRKILNHQMLHE